MNVDKIYKPLVYNCNDHDNLVRVDMDSLQDLEEKYKELLVRHIKLLNYTNGYALASQYLTQENRFLEDLTGLSWEELCRLI